MTLDPHAPAFPIPATERLRDAVGVLNPMYSGMTVRTYLAGLAMQGLLANPDRIDPAVFAEAARYGAKASDVIAGIAVTNADALLEALRSSTRPGDGPKAVTHLVGPEAERVTAPGRVRWTFAAGGRGQVVRPRAVNRDPAEVPPARAHQGLAAASHRRGADRLRDRRPSDDRGDRACCRNSPEYHQSSRGI